MDKEMFRVKLLEANIGAGVIALILGEILAYICLLYTSRCV